MSKQSGRSFPENYVLNDGVHLPRETDGRIFNYSDGDDAETYLVNVMEKVTDRSVLSQELVACIRDWPSLYHLSPKRANLLRPFAPMLKGRILEVGAGCGAITRYLGESGADVVALEPSRRRAHIARRRVADLSNVQVVCDTIEAFSSPQLFDVILCIGVLEYAALYDKEHADPHVHLLEMLREQLAPNGVVILAIENKLGLKYFAGAAEDHLGSIFHGINNSYNKDGVATFGREELAGLLRAAGLPAQAFFLPCPDYKLPITVLPEPSVSRYPELAATLMAQSASTDPQRPTEPLFSLEQAWLNLGRNHLASGLSNSFLVVASHEESAIGAFTRTNDVGWHYSVDRHPAFARAVTFEASQDTIRVKRTALSKAPHPGVPVDCILVEEPFFTGANWWMELCAVVNKPGWSIRDLAEWAQPWLEALTKRFDLPCFDTSALTKYVDGDHFDATPFNMIRDPQGRVFFFDQEWQLKPKVEFGYIVCRSLHISLALISSCATPAQGVPPRISDIIINVLAHHGAMLIQSDLDRYALIGEQLRAWTWGTMASPFGTADAEAIWSARLVERLPINRNQLAHHVDTLRKQLDDEQTNLLSTEKQRQTLAETLASTKQEIDYLLIPRISQLEFQLKREQTDRQKDLGRLQQLLESAREAHTREVEAAKAASNQLVSTLAMQAREIDKLSGSQFRGPLSTTVEKIGRVVTPWKRPRFGARSWEAGAIKASRLFRPTWYLDHNPDVAKAGIDPLLHYVLHGGSEGRWPHPLFDPKYYLAQLPEADRNAMTPLGHYVSGGAALGFSPHPLFDGAFYLRTNRDVAAAGMNPLFHFMEYGWREGRNPNPLFDMSRYSKSHPETLRSGVNPLLHYVTNKSEKAVQL